jgi:hypothetical protein
MIRDVGSSLWLQNNRSWKDHWKDTEAAGVSEKVAVVPGVSGVETETSGDSGEEIEASEDSSQEVAIKITDPKTKARSGVSVKHLVSD